MIIIPKPGKDATNTTNYHPITLTSCIYKTVDLSGILNPSLLINVQCGFRSRRSTIDHLVRFLTFCREDFVHNQHLFLVFFIWRKLMIPFLIPTRKRWVCLRVTSCQ